MRFEFSEALFDWIEVWGIGRRQPERCSGRFDHLAHAGDTDLILRNIDASQGLASMCLEGWLQHAYCLGPSFETARAQEARASSGRGLTLDMIRTSETL